jgi:hypothetical protein
MLCTFALCFESNYCFCMLNFFFQLSSVVDFRVSLNICRILKMFFWPFFTVFSHILIGWVLVYVTDFLFFGLSVHHFWDFETTIIKLCGFVALLKNRSFFWFSLFDNFSLFLCKILLRIWWHWLCSFFYISKLLWWMFTFNYPFSMSLYYAYGDIIWSLQNGASSSFSWSIGPIEDA